LEGERRRGGKKKARGLRRKKKDEEEEAVVRDRSLFLFFFLLPPLHLSSHLVARRQPHRLLGEPLCLVCVPALQRGQRGLAAALGCLLGRGLAHWRRRRGKERASGWRRCPSSMLPLSSSSFLSLVRERGSFSLLSSSLAETAEGS